MKKALITGITGQDGSYLSEFLIEKGLCERCIMFRFAHYLADLYPDNALL